MIRKLLRNWLYYIKAQHLQQVVRMHWSGEGALQLRNSQLILCFAAIIFVTPTVPLAYTEDPFC